MDQLQIYQAVARATGESMAEIQRRGFSLANPAEIEFDPEPYDSESRMVDWDELDSERLGLFP